MASSKLCLLICCLASLNFIAYSFKVKNCADQAADAKLGQVNFIGCSVDDPYCTLVKGTNATIGIQFDTGKSSKYFDA